MILACAGILTKSWALYTEFRWQIFWEIRETEFIPWLSDLQYRSYAVLLQSAAGGIQTGVSSDGEKRTPQRAPGLSGFSALCSSRQSGGMRARYLGADALEELYHRPDWPDPLRVLAPYYVCRSGAGDLPGIFSGHGNMVSLRRSLRLRSRSSTLWSALSPHISLW